jgi:hypothetical protein
LKITLLQSKHETRTFSTNPFKIPNFIKFDEIKISFVHLGGPAPHFVIARVYIILNQIIVSSAQYKIIVTINVTTF